MLERQYIVAQEARGWRVLLNEESLGLFASKDEAFAAAVDAARQSRAQGHYAWVKLRPRERAPLD